MGQDSRRREDNVRHQVSGMRDETRHVYSVRYGFNQALPLPADKAFDWCTDYQPRDFALMKEKGKRLIRRITADTILLTETTRKENRSVKKTKLVRLNKGDLSWTNTHISGPNLHSQFLYKIVPEGRTRSRLYFKGLLICYSLKALRRRQLHTIRREERRADSRIWRNLAAALRSEASGL
jgi:hypothetical protein